MRFLLLSFLAFAFYAPKAHAQLSCLNGDVAEAVAAAMKEATPESARAKATKQVEMGIAKGVIKAENKADLVEVVVEYSIRKNAKCAIPAALNARVSSALSMVQGDWKFCDMAGFNKTINRQFNSLKDSDGFDAFEAVIKQQISSNIIPDAREKFIARWDGNEGFRTRVIKAGLALNVMYSNKCSNIPDPVLNILAEF